MPEDFAIREFLITNRAEVRRMLLTEYDEEKVLAQERKETEIRTENRINERVDFLARQAAKKACAT